jgi:hypothetical protein
VLTGVVLGLDWATRATVTWRLESPGFSHGEGQKQGDGLGIGVSS